ncbi:hypothetical protein ACIBJI_31030 [Nocardia sp. NPDC050408]|uniref:hypothetical protein n=1 Tax=unclassified Nocardia TaxID=2637762 RepID=UPI00341D84C9
MGLGTALPQLITEPDEWDATADVIVVGFGIAGSVRGAASNRAHSAERMEGD